LYNSINNPKQLLLIVTRCFHEVVIVV